jgi:formylglycine-generating enzyme required for sulfatase activity
VLVSVLAGLLILAAVSAALLRERDGGQPNRQPPKSPEGVVPGTAAVVTLAEVVAIKTQAELAWEQVKGLDRGQGTGASVDEAQSLLMQANELYAQKALPEAKAAYVRLAGLCADLASAESRRKEQDFQRLLTEAKKTADGLPADKERLSAAQKSAAAVAIKAVDAALAYKPADREALALRDKFDSYHGTMTMDLGNGVKMMLVLIPAGKFTMGEENDKHEVSISNPFYMGVTEVTQAQYEAVMGTNPSNFKGATNPVEMVSWNDATEFCKKLSEQTRRAIRLPTEAEWEYACRAGTATAFSFGDADSALGDYAWYDANSGSTTHPVGQKKPNAWGLYDMHGNVWERCADWWEQYPKGPVTDPQGPASGAHRVIRGGSWGNNLNGCSAMHRADDAPGNRGRNHGFRVVVSVPAPGL